MLFCKNKKTINYLEIHITDSCNLKCKNCSHFCYLVDELILINIDDFKKDVEELSKKININTIRLMGGEPLLHPQVNEFMYYTRLFFPNSIIKLVTNGLLLAAKKSDFWDCVKKYNIYIDLSYYSLYKKYIDEVKNILKMNNIEDRLWLVDQKIFFNLFNQYGTSNEEIAFKNCTRKICTNLWNHKLYICPECFRYYYNKKNKTNIDLPYGIDIYKMSSKKIYENLTKNKPLKACRYCKEIPVAQRWQMYK